MNLLSPYLVNDHQAGHKEQKHGPGLQAGA
jgi:hypothetical protein